jgi:hypothetical protein
MNKFIHAIPLVVFGVLAYFSFAKAQPNALLPENKLTLPNPDIAFLRKMRYDWA